MSEENFNGVCVRGIVSTVPSKVTFNSELGQFDEQDLKKIIKMTGVNSRRVASESMTTSDLCLHSATKLLQDLGWDNSEIDALVFVTQTPDFVLPATSCVLHKRLGLKDGCLTFDINQGCSGFVYGLYLCSSLIQNSNVNKVLFLVGDTCSKFVSPNDRSTAPLFGDAGCAIALEKVEKARRWTFHLGTDGEGFDKLIIPAGSFRNPSTNASKVEYEDNGNRRSKEDLYMDGGEIFNFTLKRVPKMAESLFKEAEITLECPDYFIFHQANLFMLNHLRKKLKLPEVKCLNSIGDYGNTSSASIPLTICHNLSSKSATAKNLAIFGFGVGFTWGSAYINTDGLKICRLCEMS